MATATRLRTVTGAGTVVALVLVLAFGSTAYRDWVNENTNASDAGGFLLRQLAWPAWSFSSGESLRALFVADLKALLVVVLSAAFLALLVVAPGKGLRGTLGAIISVWGAFILAAAFAGLLAAFFAAQASLLGAFTTASEGATYGLFAGWVVGLVTLAFRD